MTASDKGFFALIKEVGLNSKDPLDKNNILNLLDGWQAAIKWMHKEVMTVVNEQAEDEGLWFVAEYATEDYLQRALRKLHKHIEDMK